MKVMVEKRVGLWAEWAILLALVLLVCMQAACTKGPMEAKAIETPPIAQTFQPAVDSSWPRTIKDAKNREIVLQSQPKRAALLQFHHYEALLILDIVPAAATDVETVFKGWASLRPYAERLEIIDLGDMPAPNVEKILEANPDLIIYLDGYHDAIAENLQKIAPAVAVGKTGSWATWQGIIYEYGAVFGVEEKAEQEVQRLEALIKSTRERFALLGEKTFMFIRPQEKTIYEWMPDYIFNAETGLGLKSPLEKTTQAPRERTGTGISFETLGDLNPDYIVIYNDAADDSDEAMLAKLNNEHSVWQSLDAVKQNRVFLIDRSAFSGGPLGMTLGINALLENVRNEL